MTYYIGLDIGGTKCGVCVGSVSTTGEIAIVEKEVFPTAGKTYMEILALYAEKIEKYKNKYAIRAIGIACGGPLDSKKGLIQSPPNLPDWDNVAVVQYFQDAFSIPTYLENDANACAVAEWKFGAGKGVNNMIFMTFGTGLGAGLILDGRLYSGTNGNAGEIGHVRLEEDGPIGYNKAGSAEGFCSGNGIKKLALLRAQQQGVALPDAITAKDIFENARKGDAFAKSIVEESAQKFARVVSILIDLFNPEIITAGGVFMRNYDLFMPIMQPIIEKECLSFSRDVCKIVPAKLVENVGDYSALAVALLGEEK